MAGRLGVLVTLYLLLVNNYKQLKTPAKLGYGYVDEWFILIQMPVLVAIVEYGFILIWRTYSSSSSSYATKAAVVGWMLRPATVQKNFVKLIELMTFLAVLLYLVVIIVYGCQKFLRDIS